MSDNLIIAQTLFHRRLSEVMFTEGGNYKSNYSETLLLKKHELNQIFKKYIIQQLTYIQKYKDISHKKAD